MHRIIGIFLLFASACGPAKTRASRAPKLPPPSQVPQAAPEFGFIESLLRFDVRADFSAQIPATDPQGGAVQFTSSCGDKECPETLSVSQTGLLQWTGIPGATTFESDQLDVTATNATGQSATLHLSLLGFLTPYRRGDVWQRNPASFDVLRQNMAYLGDPEPSRTAIASAIYVGSVDGAHYVVTSAHNELQRSRNVGVTDGCIDNHLVFKGSGAVAECVGLLAEWKAVDFQIVEIRFRGPVPAFEKVEFDWSDALVKDQKIAAVGYAPYRNPFRELLASDDEDCRILDGNLRQRNFGTTAEPWNIWLLPTGCEASEGDSGGSVVDRESGKVVGFITGITFDRSLAGSPSSADYRAWQATDLDELWSNATVFVPFPKIADTIRTNMADGSLNAHQLDVLKALGF